MPELINIGVSALLANEKKLATTGHNIANADTEGFTRQQTIVGTQPSQKTSAGFLGSGVAVEGVRRIVDLFSSAELRSTGDNLNRIEKIYDNSAQLDAILGDDATGLSPALQDFFQSMQTVAEDPASIGSRQVVLSKSESLVGRVNSLYDTLESQNNSLNIQFDTLTSEVTTLSKNIANLNEKIGVYGRLPINELPNDLLDERDLALKKLSEIVSVQVIENNDRTVNLFVGNGQSLVVGNKSFKLFAQSGQDDGTRFDVMYQNGNTVQRITDEISGGKLGGLLEFRENILDETYGQLGLAAIGLSDSVNEQHRLGMDLDGQLGFDYFRDVNDESWALSRVASADTNTAPGTEKIKVLVDDVSAMTTSDYRLRFAPGNNTEFSVTRLSDGAEVATKSFSGVFPSTVEFDGLSVSIEAGTFGAGDSFRLTPTRFAAREMQMNVSDVRDIALAQPARVESNQANRGTGVVGQGTITDTSTPLFANIESAGELNPPLVVEFTSPRTYSILDNSDPANPKSLTPPLENLGFVPGITNEILPKDLNQTITSADGADVGQALRNTTAGTYNNNFAAETLTVTSVNQSSEAISKQSYDVPANASAREVAQGLNELNNTTATASNYAVLSEINSSTPLQYTLNGENFSVENPQQLAQAINDNTALANNGITATSDGSDVVIRSSLGDDFAMSVVGGANDSLSVKGANGSPLTLAGTDAVPEATVSGTIEVVFAEGAKLEGETSVFSAFPAHLPQFLGLQVTLGGSPAAGDRFEINYNKDGFADNRNAVAIGGIQTKRVMANGESTIRDTYANLIDFVGTQTSDAELSLESAQTLYDRAVATREASSGVNLDEEAGNVIRFEQAYNASAQLISVARTLFDTLLNSVSR